MDYKVIIVGAGPAGIFSALTLADQGIKPILLLELGKDLSQRNLRMSWVNHHESAFGQTILRQGQQNDSFYMISKGQTQVEVEGADGTPVAVTELGPGQYFGEVSLIEQSRTTTLDRGRTLRGACRVYW